MKRIVDLEEKEIIELSNEKIEDYINYECALEGVPMLPPHPGPAPDKIKVEADTKVFEIAGYLVLDTDHAGRILDALNSGVLYREEIANFDYSLKHLTLIYDDYYAPKITAKNILSPELWDSVQKSHAAISSQLKQWKIINDEYQSSLKEREAITTQVWDHIESVRAIVCEKENIKNLFSQYLKLAEGDKSIAMNFLEKVKQLDSYPDLKEELMEEKE